MVVVAVSEGIIHSWEMRVRVRVCVAEIADTVKAENVVVIRNSVAKRGGGGL